jgi:hypothetical protein
VVELGNLFGSIDLVYRCEIVEFEMVDDRNDLHENWVAWMKNLIVDGYAETTNVVDD